MKFLVNLTYSEVTPESAKHGDFSDTGFVWEDREFSLRELISFIKDNYMGREGGTNWFSTAWETECYATGTERQENLHIKLIKGD